MSTSQCAVYQVKDAPEYRDVRFRSYEKLKSEGRTVQIENYQQVYIGRIQPGETPADIKTRLQKQRPKNFKGHSIGCDMFNHCHGNHLPFSSLHISFHKYPGEIFLSLFSFLRR